LLPTGLAVFLFSELFGIVLKFSMYPGPIYVSLEQHQVNY
jgi:hypothetical protein